MARRPAISSARHTHNTPREARQPKGAYDLPFAIAGLLLFGASLVSFAIREQRYSARYQTTTSPAGD